MFKKTKNYGPRIKLTDKQVASITARCAAHGLESHVEQCLTGSVYVEVYMPEWDKGLGDWYIGWGDKLAKIRLSGHDEGACQDSTHCAVGTKTEIMAALNRWLDEIIAEHGAAAAAIVANRPA